MLRRRPVSQQLAGCSSGSRPSDDAKSTCQQDSTMNSNGQETAPTKCAEENPARAMRRRTVVRSIPAQMHPSMYVPQATLEKGLLVTDVNTKQVTFLRRRVMATTTINKQHNATDAEANPATDTEANPAKMQLKRKLASKHNFIATRATKQKQVAETSTKPEKRSRRFIQGSLEWEKHCMFRVAFNMCNPDGSWKLHPALQFTKAGPRELDVLNILYLTLENQGPRTSNLFFFQLIG